MRARLVAVDDPAWVEVLSRAPHDIYHLPAYTHLSKLHEGGQACALLVESGSREFLLPLIRRFLPGDAWDVTTPYGYPGPIGRGVEDVEYLSDALEAGSELLREQGCVSLFARLHPLLNRVTPTRHGRVIDHGPTVGIDLTLPSDQIWQGTRENHRRQISRAIRAGFRVDQDDSDEAVRAFRHVYEATMRRLDAAAYYFFDDAYYQELCARLGAHARYFIVRSGADVAGAALFFEANGLVQYHLSGADERYLASQPTKLAIHETIAWAKGRGDRWLHLGGGLGAGEDALFHFKAGFGPLRHRFRTLRLVVDPGLYRSMSGCDPTAPIDLDGYFPAYRRSQLGSAPPEG